MTMPKRALISAVVGAIIAVFIIEPAIDRSKPYERGPGHIEPEPALRGQSAKISYPTKVLRRCDGKVWRHVIDGNGMDHDYAPHDALISKLEFDQPMFSIQFVLPAVNSQGVTDREWQYYADIDYYCNWFQRYVWPIRERTPVIRFRAQ